MTAGPASAGREHWAQKGSIRLFRIAYHLLHGFFSQPAPRYRGH